ncbi:hypothetical protein As57867_005974, partial [Aphanomyces stellatus]
MKKAMVTTTPAALQTGSASDEIFNQGYSPATMIEPEQTEPHGLKINKKWFLIGITVVILGLAGSLIAVLVTRKSAFELSLEAPQEIKKMPVYKYRCTANQCVYQNLTKAEMIAQTPTMGPGLMSLRVCEMTCGNGSMLPLPTSVSFGSADTVAVDITSFSHSVSGADGSLVKDMQAAFTELLQYKKKLAVGGIQDSG